MDLRRLRFDPNRPRRQTACLRCGASTELDDPLAAIDEFEDERPKADALCTLASCLVGQQVSRAMSRAMSLADPEHRSRALRSLVPRTEKLSQRTLATLLCGGDGRPNVLRAAAGRRREELLDDIRVSSPILLRVGGGDLLEEIIRCTDDVGRWWP